MSTYTKEVPLPTEIGKPVSPEYEKTLQRRIAELLDFRLDGFPGSQPVNFEASHFKVLENEEYYVCEKTDGVRYIMFANRSPKGHAIFLLDRKNKIHFIEGLNLPLRDDPDKFHHETMMDGELVIDLDDDKKILRFLVFDLMVVNGNVVTKRSLSTRLGLFNQDVIEPLKASLDKSPELAEMMPFTVELKEMERSYGIPQVFHKIPHLKHANDGLIFTPVRSPYITGTCHKLLKWKPADSMTVDFKLKVVRNKERKPLYQLWIAQSGIHEFYDHLTPDEHLADAWRQDPPNELIAEFWYDPNWTTMIYEDGYAPHRRAGGWRFSRFRNDKSSANDKSVLTNIQNSIADAITKEMLERHCEKIRQAWKQREKYQSQNPNLAPRLSISQPSMPPTPTFPSGRFSDAGSPNTPSSAHSSHPPSISPSVGPSGGGYFSRKFSTDSWSPLERGSSMSQASTEQPTSERQNFADRISNGQESLTKSPQSSRAIEAETIPERKPLQVLPTSQELGSSQEHTASSRRSFMSETLENPRPDLKSPSPELGDLSLPEKTLVPETPPIQKITTNTEISLPPRSLSNQETQNRKLSPQKRRITEIASILSPIEEEMPRKKPHTPVEAPREKDEPTNTSRDLSPKSTKPPLPPPLNMSHCISSNEVIQSPTPLSATNTENFERDEIANLHTPKSQLVSPITETDIDEQRNIRTLSMGSSNSRQSCYSTPKRSTRNDSVSLPPQNIESPVEYSDSHFLKSLSSSSQAQNDTDQFSKDNDHSHTTNPELVSSNNFDNNSKAYETEGTANSDDDKKTHIFINYSNNPLPASQQSQTRPPLSALQTGIIGAPPSQYSYSSTSVSSEIPTSNTIPTSSTTSASSSRPAVQKRRSKAMLEFILNDSTTSNDSDTKRARYDWD